MSESLDSLVSDKIDRHLQDFVEQLSFVFLPRYYRRKALYGPSDVFRAEKMRLFWDARNLVLIGTLYTAESKVYYEILVAIDLSNFWEELTTPDAEKVVAAYSL